MASFSVHATTSGSAVYTASLDRSYPRVLVTWRNATGAAGTELYVTADGSSPAVLGVNTWVVPSVQGTSKVVRAVNTVDAHTGLLTPTVVKLISTGAIAFSVEGLD